MIENWNDVHIVPEFSDQGVDCYRLAGGSFVNEYYIVSEAETRKLMNHPEVVGYEVYASLVTATSQMMYYLKEQKKITSANILSILRGALNYPLEESCYKEHIRVHDISFMSSERVFGENDEMSLDIKYCKLTMVPNSTLYKISNDMQSLLLVAVVLTLGVGLVCSYLVSRGLAHPIRQLSDEIAAIKDKRTTIPKLSRTGIRELDGFSTATHPAQSGYSGLPPRNFLRIMDMASIELGGYEMREDSDKVS